MTIKLAKCSTCGKDARDYVTIVGLPSHWAPGAVTATGRTIFCTDCWKEIAEDSREASVARMTNTYGAIFGNYLGIERPEDMDWRRAIRIPEMAREIRKYYFLPDSVYSASIHGRDPAQDENFQTFARICKRFKQLGGNMVYYPATMDVIGSGSGTLFIDDRIPEEFRDEAADLFEGQQYEIKELTVLKQEIIVP